MTVAGASLVGGVIFMGLVARDELERRRLGCDFEHCHEHWDRGKRNTQVEFAMFGVAVGLGIIGAILLGVDASRQKMNASAVSMQPHVGLTGKGLLVRF